MDIEHPKSPIESGWKTETEEHREYVRRFLQNYLSTPYEGRREYDPLVGLHISGLNTSVLRKIGEGTANIISVSTLYEGPMSRQIHVVFDSEGTGQNIDVYLRGQALEDYWEGSIIKT